MTEQRVSPEELEAILRAEIARLRGLASTWESQANDYPASYIGDVGRAAVRCCARELRAALGGPDA